MASFMDFLFGKDEKTQQFQRFTPDQQNVLNQMLGGASRQLPQAFEFLSNILSGDPEAIKRFEAPARRSFERETLPAIAERFTGELGGQRSSAFGQQLGRAASDLETNLSAQRSQLGFNALNQLQSLLGSGLSQQFDTVVRPATGGFLEGFGPQAASSLAQLLPLLLA